MEGLFTFLRKLIMLFLVAIFIAVGTFTGQAEAQEYPAFQNPDIEAQEHPAFQNPDVIDADQYKITLEATNGEFTIGGDSGNTYPGLLYGTRYAKKEGETQESDCTGSSTFNEDRGYCEYDPEYNPPVIVVSPGETMDLTLDNSLPVLNPELADIPPVKYNLEAVSQDTNLHYHGFNVSPLLGADDVMVPIPSSKTPKIQNNLFTPTDSADSFNAIPTATHNDGTANIYQELPSKYLDSSGSDFPGNNDFGPINKYHMIFDLPEGHQKGLFWFHSHQHGSSDRQVRSGMSGGIVVKGIATAFPVLQNMNITEEDVAHYGKIMLFKDFNDYLGTDSKEPKPKFWALNDLKDPEITINSFEDRFWRIGNIGADTYLNLTFVKPDSNPNHTPDLGLPKFLILSRDVSQNYFANLSLTDSILVPPAGRVELIVVGGEPGETYELISVNSSNTPQPYTPGGNVDLSRVDPNENYYYLASVTVPTTSKSQLPKGLLSPKVCSNTEGGLKACLKSLKLGQLAGGEILPNPNTLAAYAPCTGEANDTCVVSSSSDPEDKFEFIFNKGDLNPGTVFTINGELYDGSRINKIVNVGTNQDWKLVNQGKGDHAFHIHQLDFIMTEVTVPNDYLLEDPDGRKFYDNYPVTCDNNPATLPNGGQGSHCTLEADKHGYRDTINLPANSEITVRIPFLNPFITGVFVYHCHILSHEDSGMMQNVKVVNPKSYIPPALRDKWLKQFLVKDNE